MSPVSWLGTLGHATCGAVTAVGAVGAVTPVETSTDVGRWAHRAGTGGGPGAN